MSDPCDLDAFKCHGVRDSERVTGLSGDGAEKAVGVERAAETIDVDLVRSQRGHSVGERVGDIDTVLRLMGAHDLDVRDSGPWFEGFVEKLWEDPPVGCVTRGVQRSEADVSVVRLVQDVCPLRQRVGRGENEVRLEFADSAGEISSKWRAVFDRPVGIVEELDV